MVAMNAWFRRLGFLVVMAILAASTLSAAPVTPIKVNPLVLADTANGKVGNFLVILRQQANPARLAQGAASWHEQGLSVVNGLKQAALSSQGGVQGELSRMGASYRAYWITNLVAVQAGRSVVAAMATRADVAAIEPDRAFRVPLETLDAVPPGVSPADPFGAEWNLAQVGAPQVWEMGFTGQGSVYANADTGVEWTHPALKAHYRGWDGSSADHNFNWWDAVHTAIVGGSSCGYNLQAPCDDLGHGTHTMGTGIGNDGAGNQVGIAPGAKWIACRNMDGITGRPSTYIECLQFFIAPTDLAGNNANPDLRPDVISNSYGCPPDELCGPHDLQAAVEAVRAAGIFMAVSAGNSGSGCSSISDPPPLEASVFTVGATNSADTIASFSSRGPVTVDGSNRRKPEISAPGVGIRSSTFDGGYGFMSGTSMAAPLAAGAVALLWSANPLLRGNVSLTESILEQSAAAHTSSQGCGGDLPDAVPNNVYGYGRLDVQAAFAEFSTTAPSGLSAKPISHTEIDLVWNSSNNNEDGFQIQRSPSGQNHWELIATTGTGVTSYADKGVKAYTKYDYRVHAFTDDGISPYTPLATAATPAFLVALPYIQR